METSNKWNNSPLDKVHEAKVQNFGEKACKKYETDMSQSFAP